MPYDKAVDRRIQKIIAEWPHTEAKNMFGGVGYLLNGNMVAGVYKDNLVLRLGEEIAQGALKEDHVKPFDITGRPMKGWVMVSPEGFRGYSPLNQWLKLARQFVQSLPAK